ncbi:hypothetical protein [Candidatus Acetatifactor stercoripullorum]|uniref:hypothetical protein n=1 Tax=Candidatus Acetatifactor stercoripullorum TaxID=2838414 RepID=UPI00298E37DD|nr:hypothetical protein [Candidatus Acetatifactor stercoripullorum]
MKKMAVAVCTVLALVSAGCGNESSVVGEHTEAEESSVFETTQEEMPEEIQKETQQEALEEWNEEAAKAAKVYEYWGDFKDEKNLPYADEATVSLLLDAYGEFEYEGSFETGSQKYYSKYIEKYKRLVDSEVPFLDDEGEAFYVNEYEWREAYSNARYYYYFFDIDGDDEPELGILGTSGNYFLNVYDYDREADEFRLWYSEGGDAAPGGERKIFWVDFMHIGLRYGFHQLDAEGKEEAEGFFFFTPFNEEETLCAVMVPRYADESREIALTDEMKSRGIYVTSYGGMWFFRIPQAEFAELEKAYEEARMEAEKRREEVTYTYEELFGEES